MITGVTKTGFAFEVPRAALDDMQLVDALAELETNPLALSAVVKMVLDPAQKAALYDHVRTPDGHVPLELLEAELTDIFSAGGKSAKN